MCIYIYLYRTYYKKLACAQVSYSKSLMNAVRYLTIWYYRYHNTYDFNRLEKSKMSLAIPSTKYFTTANTCFPFLSTKRWDNRIHYFNICCSYNRPFKKVVLKINIFIFSPVIFSPILRQAPTQSCREEIC